MTAAETAETKPAPEDDISQEGQTQEGVLEDVEEKVPAKGRGREARSPLQIPARGWKDILLRVYRRTMQDRLGLIAAGVTFYGIMGLFPAIVALVSVYGLLTDASALQDQISFLAGYLPPNVLDLLSTELQRISQSSDGSLGVAAIVSIVLALWSVSTAVRAAFQALNVAYGEAEERAIWRLYGTAFAVAIAIIILAVVVVNVIVVLPLLLNALGFSERSDFYMRLLSAPLFFVVMVASASVLYRLGPSRKDARWHWISFGSVLFSVIWIAAALGVSFYLSRFADYSATYGSLGAVIGLMLWIYVTAYIFLIGAEINAEIEHQTAVDTTVGPEKPMGERGAHVADTLGATSGDG